MPQGAVTILVVLTIERRSRKHVHVQTIVIILLPVEAGRSPATSLIWCRRFPLDEIMNAPDKDSRSDARSATGL